MDSIFKGIETLNKQIILSMMERKFTSAFHIFGSYQKNAKLFTF
ncbi:hypothetical protein P4311_29390 [Bacillus thuringiensis]|nr:hypothetical protein [Bacillus thuringiensis]